MKIRRREKEILYSERTALMTEKCLYITVDCVLCCVQILGYLGTCYLILHVQ